MNKINHNKFKVGAIVRCISDSYSDRHCKNKLGKIIDIDDNPDYPYTVEFFESMSYGHDGDGKGKLGYYRWFENKEIELYQPILKLFLKEKPNES